MPGENGSDGAGKDQDQGGAQKIQVGDKTYTADDIKGLVSQAAKATQVGQVAETVNTIASRYGLDPEGYLGQAELALGAVASLMEKGIIDDQGNLVQGKRVVENKGEEDKSGDTGGEKKTGKVDPDTIAAAVLERIEGKLSPVFKALDSIEKTQNHMLRQDLEAKLKSEFSNLDSEDIDRVLASAFKDKKPVKEIAKTYSEKKAGMISELRKQHAKEFGVNLDDFDANRLNEQGGGGAAAAFTGKKFSFRGGKDVVSPREAARAYIEKVRQES